MHCQLYSHIDKIRIFFKDFFVVINKIKIWMNILPANIKDKRQVTTEEPIPKTNTKGSQLKMWNIIALKLNINLNVDGDSSMNFNLVLANILTC